MKAYLRNYRQSPRKVRVVANLIKNKPVQDAVISLSFIPKRAGLPLKKLVQSAIANAKTQGKDEKNLVVSTIRVDKGIVLKRSQPRSRGMANPIMKRTSHVIVELKERVESQKSKGKAKKKEANNLKPKS